MQVRKTELHNSMLLLRNNFFHRQCNDFLGVDSQNSLSISCVPLSQFSLFKTLHIITRLQAVGVFHIVLGIKTCIKCSTREKLSLLSKSKALKQISFFFSLGTPLKHNLRAFWTLFTQQWLELKLANKIYTLPSTEFLSVNITRISHLKRVYSLIL